MTHLPLGQLTSVRVADVYKAERLAARLTRTRTGIEFEYLPEYLRERLPSVATTLPLDSAPIQTSAGAVPPFFAGLLPEGRRLTALRRAVKTSADDELSLLLAVGRDTVGDVRVVPEGELPDPPDALVETQSDWSDVRFADLLSSAGMVDAVGLAGAQEKVSARMISLPLRRYGERYILKLTPPEYPLLVENEGFFLELSRSAGIRTAESALVTDSEGVAGLLVRRFDRVSTRTGRSVSLACEDASQVLGIWPADKYRVSLEDAINGLADRCTARPVAVRAWLQQAVFAWLTGNGDLHAKNLSILCTPEGEWRAAPAYDLPSTVPYGDSVSALSIQGRKKGFSRKHFLELASAVGLRERAAVKILDELLQATEGLEARLRAGEVPFPQKTIAVWTAELRHRRRQLSHSGGSEAAP